jgi:uncharacterized OB-fold protein
MTDMAGLPPGEPSQFFWDGIEERRLLVQQCRQCARLRHPPGPMCGECQSMDADVVEVSGRGRVRSWILSRHPNAPDEEPRVVVLVELDEGPRMVSNLIGTDPDMIGNDVAVEVCFEEHQGALLPQFRIVEDAR